MRLRSLPPEVKALLARLPEDRLPEDIERAWRSLAADADFLKTLVAWALPIFRGPSAEDVASAYFLDPRKIPTGPPAAVAAALGKTGLGRVLRGYDLRWAPDVNLVDSFGALLRFSFRRFCFKEWGRMNRRNSHEIGGDDTDHWPLIGTTDNDPESTVRTRELRATIEKLNAAIEKLRPLDREVIVMHHLKEWSIAEIAQTLRISESAVAVRLFRARQRLAKLLKGPVQ